MQYASVLRVSERKLLSCMQVPKMSEQVQERSERVNKDNITYMDCWSYIAPTIPITEDPISTRIYVMVFKALSDADEREKAEREKK